MTHKSLREQDKLASRYGFIRKRGGGRSHPIYSNGTNRVIGSSSSSDRRALLNFEAQLKRTLR